MINLKSFGLDDFYKNEAILISSHKKEVSSVSILSNLASFICHVNCDIYVTLLIWQKLGIVQPVS